MTHQQQTAFENIVGKGEIARNEQFLPFPQCFLLNQIIASQFVNIFHNMSLFATQLEEPKIGISGKRLKKNVKTNSMSQYENDKCKTCPMLSCFDKDFQKINLKVIIKFSRTVRT